MQAPTAAPAPMLRLLGQDAANFERHAGGSSGQAQSAPTYRWSAEPSQRLHSASISLALHVLLSQKLRIGASLLTLARQIQGAAVMLDEMR